MLAADVKDSVINKQYGALMEPRFVTCMYPPFCAFNSETLSLPLRLRTCAFKEPHKSLLSAV